MTSAVKGHLMTTGSGISHIPARNDGLLMLQPWRKASPNGRQGHLLQVGLVNTGAHKEGAMGGSPVTPSQDTWHADMSQSTGLRR